VLDLGSSRASCSHAASRIWIAALLCPSMPDRGRAPAAEPSVAIWQGSALNVHVRCQAAVSRFGPGGWSFSGRSQTVDGQRAEKREAFSGSTASPHNHLEIYYNLYHLVRTNEEAGDSKAGVRRQTVSMGEKREAFSGRTAS
jgi:hypothetical protein